MPPFTLCSVDSNHPIARKPLHPTPASRFPKSQQQTEINITSHHCTMHAQSHALVSHLAWRNSQTRHPRSATRVFAQSCLKLPFPFFPPISRKHLQNQDFYTARYALTSIEKGRFIGSCLQVKIDSDRNSMVWEKWGRQEYRVGCQISSRAAPFSATRVGQLGWETNVIVDIYPRGL
ncbi:hypothetical protein DL98DRAFT_184139 [Cadophora sp. DSE1049]|nr:hypothetical protein DL98DRAFT_184139 [Cadophora sp. DSE1049]